MEEFNYYENAIDKEKIEAAFKRYLEYFNLTEEELQKPILDVGAGNGYFVAYVRDVLGNKEAYGIEKNQLKVFTANEGIKSGNALNIDFPDESFEIVVSKDFVPMFFENYDDLIKVIGEMLRVTKGGGKTIFNTMIKSEILQDIDNDELYPDQDTKKWLKLKANVSGLFMNFLESLDKLKYRVDFTVDGKNTRIVTINKL